MMFLSLANAFSVVKRCFLAMAMLSVVLLQASETRWYSYRFDGVQVGYARVCFNYKQKDRSLQKSKLKFRQLEGKSFREEYSAVLNDDYSLRSAWLSQEQGGKKRLWVITIANGISIQIDKQIIALPQQKFYLEIEDFLKSLPKKTTMGRIYKGQVLATDWKSLTRVKARYLGKEDIYVNFSSYRARRFKVKTDEFRNFWAMAWLSEDGELLGYRLGKFDVFTAPAQQALLFLKQRTPLPAPVIFEPNSIRSLTIKISRKQAKIFPKSPYQEIKKNTVLLKNRRRPRNDLSLAELAKKKLAYLKSSPLTPLDHPLIEKYAPLAGQEAKNPVKKAKNIAAWVNRNLVLSSSDAGKKLEVAFGMSKDTSALVTTALCRANGIPCRLAAGIVYNSGRLSYESWAEAYLSGWFPLYQGKLSREARFLKIHSNSVWSEQKKIPALSLSVQAVVKGQHRMLIDVRRSYFEENKGNCRDMLLGISWKTPKAWVLAAKSVFSDTLLFQSQTNNVMLLKVFQAPKPLEQVLESLRKRMKGQTKLEILLQESRVFPGGTAREMAVKSTNGKYIYRGFAAEKGNKGVLVLLIVSEKKWGKDEKGFQSLISSIGFIEE